MRKDEERLFDALEYTGQPCLPEPVDENTPLWIYAIVKVLMTNLSTGYAVVKNDFGELPYILKIFGNGAVASFQSIHPYKFLDNKYMPEVKDGKDAEAFVRKVFGIDRATKLKKGDVARGIYLYAMGQQLKDEQQNGQRNDIRETEQD